MLGKRFERLEVVEEFGKDIVNSLCVTGLIKKRQENTSVNSWKITNDGLNFITTIIPAINIDAIINAVIYGI